MVAVGGDKHLSAVRIDLDPRILQKLYWVLPLSATEREAVQAVQDNPLHSILVVDDDGQVVGALTKSEAVRGKCKKNPTKKCRQECERRCAKFSGDESESRLRPMAAGSERKGPCN